VAAGIAAALAAASYHAGTPLHPEDPQLVARAAAMAASPDPNVRTSLVTQLLGMARSIASPAWRDGMRPRLAQASATAGHAPRNNRSTAKDPKSILAGTTSHRSRRNDRFRIIREHTIRVTHGKK
jgi:hypothetical protein